MLQACLVPPTSELMSPLCVRLQLEAHKKRGKTGPLHGLSGLVLVQVGEVLYTANTAGKAEAILCK